VRSLQNGATNYFSATSTSDEDDISVALSRLALDATLKAGDTADGDISLSNVRIRRQDAQVKVTGTLTNNDDDELFSPKVCAVVKDDDGNVLIVAKTSPLGNLDEDDDVDFTLTINALNDADAVDSVSIYADGLEGSSSGTPVEPVSDENNDVTVCGTPTNTPTNTPTPTGTPQPTNTPGGPAATSTATPCF
jgi:hypothetical protein